MVAPPVKKPTSTQTTTPVKKQNNAFDIDRFSQDFAKMSVLQENRQVQERNALQAQSAAQSEIMTLSEESLKIKQGYLEGLTPLVDQSKKIAEASQRQMQLQSSGSFVDQLQAMQDAMLNPRLATSDGRGRLRAELNAQASTLATLAEANQNVLSTKMDLVKMGLSLKQAGLEEAKLLENQHGEMMKAEAIRVETIRSGLANNASAQQLILDQMTPEDITQARQDAVKTNGKVNISGFEIPSSVLESELAKRTAVQYDLQSKAMALAQNNQEMIKKANERILAALSTDQLGNLKMGNGVELIGPGGEKQTLSLGDFDLGQVNAHYESKQQAFNDKITEQNNAIMWGDTRNDIIERSANMDSLLKKTKPGTPEHEYAKRRISTLVSAKDAIDHAESLVDPKNPYSKIAFDSMQAKLGEALKKEDTKDAQILETTAKSMGRGDKDLTAAAREYLSGQPVSQQPVIDYVTRKAANNEDVSQMLGPQGARIFKKNYETLLNEYRTKQNSVTGALLSGDSIKEKEYKQQIAYEALQKTINQTSQTHVDTFIGLQAELNKGGNTELSTNPVANARDAMGRKLWTPEAFLGFVGDADKQGLVSLRQAREYEKLDDSDVARLRNGESIAKDGVTIDAETFRQHLAARQNIALLESLDRTKPGLAREYVNWWSEKGASYGQEYVRNQMQKPGATLPDAAINTMQADILDGAINEYGAGLNQVYSAYKIEQQKQRQDWVSYDLDPGNRQAALLQFDPNLTADEKKTIFRHAIRPLLLTAKKQNMDYEQTNILIERALESPENNIPGFKENASLKKAINKMLPTRESVATQLQALTDSPWLYGNNQPLADSIWNQLGASAWKRNPQQGLRPGLSELGGMPDTAPTPRGINLGIFGTYDKWLKDETATRPYDWYRNLLMEEQQPPQNLEEDMTGGR